MGSCAPSGQPSSRACNKSAVCNSVTGANRNVAHGSYSGLVPAFVGRGHRSVGTTVVLGGAQTPFQKEAATREKTPVRRLCVDLGLAHEIPSPWCATFDRPAREARLGSTVIARSSHGKCWRFEPAIRIIPVGRIS